MDQSQELNAAATAAGLRDPDLLKVAKADLPPQEALLDLMSRFPGAFGMPQHDNVEQPSQPKRFVPPRRFEAMTQAEREAFIRPPHISSPMPLAAHPFRRA